MLEPWKLGGTLAHGLTHPNSGKDILQLVDQCDKTRVVDVDPACL